jgi:phosphoglycolate phosphatase
MRTATISLRNQYSFIIFDWDGTLMDSTGRIISAMQATAKQANMPVPSEQQVKSIIGLSMAAVMDTLFPTADQTKRVELLEIYRYQYIEGDQTPSPLFAGTLDLLNWLKSNQIKIAVATGKARAGLDRVMKASNLQDFFDFSICADEAESKPHPQMVNDLLQKANKTATQTLVIGDSVHDLKMAQNANVDSLGVTSGANQLNELEVFQPQVIVDSVCHVRQWLQS